MKQKLYLIAPIVVLLLLFLILISFFLFRKKGKSPEEQITPSSASTLQQEILCAEETIKVILFLPSPEDEFLHPEERKIFKTRSLSNQVKQVILEIMKGSEKGNLNPIPSQTKIREIYIHTDGTAYLDLTSEFVTGNPGGSSSELEAIYTIVNSIAFNFSSIKRVHFLIDGMERDTLKGHLRLDRPFVPNYSIIKDK